MIPVCNWPLDFSQIIDILKKGMLELFAYIIKELFIFRNFKFMYFNKSFRINLYAYIITICTVSLAYHLDEQPFLPGSFYKMYL